MQTVFPFSAVVGQDDLKLALLLNLIDPSLGGVLAVGDKGTGKTTLIRSLAALMNAHEPFPFINLPIGASEDRVLGHINLETLINEKQEQVTPGLLAKAHEGVLYVDEINLLNDYLMDVLLDASSSGSYYLEREGISKMMDSQFGLVASMNPEEGELRPQLKDRFGLSVHITTPNDIGLRTRIIQYRMAFDDDPSAFIKKYEKKETQLYQKIKTAQKQLRSLQFSESLYEQCATIAAKHAVEGLRADILLLKAARAYAAFLETTYITSEHIETIMPMVLNHRANQQPESEKNQQHSESPKPSESEQEDQNQSSIPEAVFEPMIPLTHLETKTDVTQIQNKGGMEVPQGSSGILTSTTGTAKIDAKKTVGQYLATNSFELKHKKTQHKTTKHLVFLLDSSGSMQKEARVAYAKGLIQKTIEQNTSSKVIISLLSLYEGDVEVVASFVKKIAPLIQQLETLKTGGKTNGVAGFRQIRSLTLQKPLWEHELIMITDGRFNSEGTNDLEHTVMAYHTYCKKIAQLTIVDTETGIPRLGLAKQFAKAVKGKYQLLEI